MITLRRLVLYSNKKQMITAFFMITLRGLVLYSNKKQMITAFFMITLRELFYFKSHENHNKVIVPKAMKIITLRIM
jgi:hypothetical protein